MWRELVKAGVAVRAFMCLDEDSVYENEESARALYTRLAETVHSQYVLKLPKERQGALWETADTLQCIPLHRYFEEVWGTHAEK
ncbi:hypothetical protein KIPB_011218 [Kipferlia bialata]|uniref:Uncharacterized protein n=1 Tax=Kipferlia bialata TaxID=797122 RepID=A0A9K3GNK8_9EUKA|nr:hypothetical protein KIPB_011218 [Kipferlia bialata]|eukprot:g11218.t1